MALEFLLSISESPWSLAPFRGKHTFTLTKRWCCS